MAPSTTGPLKSGPSTGLRLAENSTPSLSMYAFPDQLLMQCMELLLLGVSRQRSKSQNSLVSWCITG